MLYFVFLFSLRTVFKNPAGFSGNIGPVGELPYCDLNSLVRQVRSRKFGGVGLHGQTVARRRPELIESLVTLHAALGSGVGRRLT